MPPDKFRIPNSEFPIQPLYPVILAVPEAVREYKPRDRVIFLSRHARLALEKSAARTRIPMGRLRQAQNGAPLPFDGTYWSISHKPCYVAGVVAPRPIGIDIEKIHPCAKGLFEKTAGPDEWDIAGADSDSLTTFFRYWTAKEAVVKAAGTGLKDLLKCKITAIVDARHLTIRYDARDWGIEHFFFDGHITSIVSDGERIQWSVEQ